MHHVYYQPQGAWVGDIMPYAENGTFYLYHQRDTRDPAPLGQPFGWALASTNDFVTYTDFGECLEHGAADEPDQFVYAGTVFKLQDRYAALYTGFNREFLKAGRASQILMQAKSTDGVIWHKASPDPALSPQRGYDARNWRDPFVWFDDVRQEYQLILAARKGTDKRLLTGRLVRFISRDLKTWDFAGDFWNPGLYTMLEMPDLFRIGEWWYLVFSEYSDRNKTHYRMAKTPYGPWTAPLDDAFDGRAYYAARTAFDGSRRVLFGWVPTRDEHGDAGSYLWGGTFVPLEITQRFDGSLGVTPPESLWNSFSARRELKTLKLSSCSGRSECILSKDAGNCYRFETNLEAALGTESISIGVWRASETGVSFEYRLNLRERSLEFHACPEYPWYRCMSVGLIRPLDLQKGKPIRIRLIVDDTISTIFVDDTALNARVCEMAGNGLSIAVTDGEIASTSRPVLATI